MTSESETNVSGSLDLIFKVLLLLFCLAMLAVFIYTGFIKEGEFSQKIFNLLVSTGGMAGTFVLYMRWRLLELIIAKAAQDPGSVNPELIKNASKLFPKA